MPDAKLQEIPIQPVNKPILCSPYEQPTAHWVYDTATGAASQFPGRRPAGYWFKTRRTGWRNEIEEVNMAIQKQLTGMQGVFLVAAELSRRGYIVSPTSRNACGADLLVTDQDCKKAFSVSVKTNARTFGFWLFQPKAREMHSPSHVYVLVNLRRDRTEYFVVPSKVLAENIKVSKSSRGTVWYEFKLATARKYENNWALFA